MNLGSIRPPKGAVKRAKRVGRGPGSGHGGTSCRGEKGQKSRSGAKHRAWFEGGQTPLVRRIPKKGFTGRLAPAAQVVNLCDLDRVELFTEITPEVLKGAGLIRDAALPVKILGTGEVSSPVVVIATAFSREAKSKIETAGGEARVYASGVH